MTSHSKDAIHNDIGPLLEDNMGLIVNMVKMFKPRSSEQFEEYKQLGLIGAWKGIQNHDPSRGKLSTVICNYAKWEILRHLTKEKNKQQNIEYFGSLDESISSYEDSADDLNEYMPDIMSDDERLVLDLNRAGYNITEISKELSQSRWIILKILKSAKSKIEHAN